MIVERSSFHIRGLVNDTKIRGWRMGDWAVHRQLALSRLYCLTLVPIGLSLPLSWASFATLRDALKAMSEIVRMKNSWARVTQEDLTTELEAQLKAICSKYNAVEGPTQFAVDADQRLNGYR